jgi:hypothetical protein
MGFAAASVSGLHGLSGDDNCGQCYELRFTDQEHRSSSGWPWGGSHPQLAGKSMVVQVTNIGYDVIGEHSFDLMIPGAGQGAFNAGCPRQFPGYSSGQFDCNNNWGGCGDVGGCASLPPELRAGCEWRYTWYYWNAANGKTNNPYVDFRRVRCPSQLIGISGSAPLDDGDFPAIDVGDYA